MKTIEMKEATDKHKRKWDIIITGTILANVTFITCSIVESSAITRLIMLISGSFIFCLCVFVAHDYFFVR